MRPEPGAPFEGDGVAGAARTAKSSSPSDDSASFSASAAARRARSSAATSTTAIVLDALRVSFVADTFVLVFEFFPASLSRAFPFF